MADKLLRFKDVLAKEGIGPLENPKDALDFDDLHVTNYRPGEDPIVNYRAYRRKRVQGAGSGEGGPIGESTNPLENQPLSTGKHKKNVGMGYTGKHKVIKTPGQSARHVHVFQLTGEDTDVDEALTVQQRMARKRAFKRLQPKIKIGREKAKRRIASKEKLMQRARKQIRMKFFKRFTKDIPKDDLTYARRQEIEKRLEKPQIKKRIDQLAKRAFPKVRQAEIAKKRGPKK